MGYDGIVIGGGAAGMFAAITAAKRGAQSPHGPQGDDHRQGPLQRDQQLRFPGGFAERPPERAVSLQRHDGLPAGKDDGLF